jgi:hypothetical protein
MKRHIFQTNPSAIESWTFNMAQSFQASQRLLGSLALACRYHQSRTTLLSNHFRTQSGFACAAPAATGFSIKFADGPLENVTAKPSEEIAEAPKRTQKKASSSRQTKLTRRTTKQDGTESTTFDVVTISEVSPIKKTKIMKRLPTKDRAGRKPTKSTTRVADPISKSEDSAWHETDETEVEESIDNMDEENQLQRDYPDTRTIQEAGRQPRAQQGETATKPEDGETRRSVRPLSTYKETWQVQKAVLKTKFAEGWNPRKKLSPDTMDGIRALHAQYPARYTTPVLAEQFAVSAEAIRRILKSKWSSNLEPEKAAEIKERWAKRHDRIWDIKSEIGLRPKRKGAKEVEDPDQFEEELRGRQLLEAYRSA